MILRARHRDGRGGGFSLLELLVVLVLLGFVAGMAGPAVGRFMNTLTFKKQVGKVMAVIRYARLVAITDGSPVLVQVSENSNTLTFSGAIVKDRDLGLKEGDTITMEPATIRFSPDGHATPAVISLMVSEHSQKIVIDPLSGLPILKFDEN